VGASAVESKKALEREPRHDDLLGVRYVG